MNSERTPAYPSPSREEERMAPSSRLIDEKISDDSGTEARADKTFAPTGLSNPFWK